MVLAQVARARDVHDDARGRRLARLWPFRDRARIVLAVAAVVPVLGPLLGAGVAVVVDHCCYATSGAALSRVCSIRVLCMVPFSVLNIREAMVLPFRALYIRDCYAGSMFSAGARCSVLEYDGAGAQRLDRASVLAYASSAGLQAGKKRAA